MKVVEIHEPRRRRRRSLGTAATASQESQQQQAKIVYVQATMSDSAFNAQWLGEPGFPPDYYTTVIDSECEIWGKEDEKSPAKFLMHYKPNVFTDAEQLLARAVFEKQASRAQSYRRRASITKRQGMGDRSSAHTMIAGYWDKRDASTTQKLRGDIAFAESRARDEPLPNTVCRTTAFTAKDKPLWERGLQWIQTIARQHQLLAPDAYKWQLAQAAKCLSELVIIDTPYSTLTVNFNWATNIHKDSGDLGLGNLSVTGTEGDWSGCWFCMPRFKVAVKAAPRSFLVADVHEFHCNTPLVKHSPDAVRLSFVAYLRDKMHECKQQVNLESGETIYVPE